jgi:hypothetical protein
MFERLGLDVALAGDLLEECARGRSTAWYWKQVLAAIWTGIWGAIFHHKLLALRAVATGCAVNGVWLFLWLNFLHLRLTVMPPDTRPLLVESIAYLSILLFTQAATGWIVARTHRPHAIPLVLVFALWLVVWFLVDDSPVIRLALNSIDQPRFRQYLAWYLAPIFIEVAGLLLGGIGGAGKKQPSPPSDPEIPPHLNP